MKSIITFLMLVTTGVAHAQGTVGDEMFSEEALAAFKKDVCKLKRKPSKADEKKCHGRIVDAFYARVRERYPLADRDFVNNHCVGHPKECEDSSYYERVMAASHSLVQEARENAAKQQAEYQQALETQAAAQAEQAEAANRAARFQAAGQALQNLSNQLGGGGGRRCVSRPNIFGGQTMECN